MGLNHPEDLEQWRRWQRSRNRLRTLKAAITRPEPAELVLLHRGDNPTVLFALDAVTPSALAAVLAPAAYLEHAAFEVLAPRAVAEALLRDGHLPGATAASAAGVADAAVAPTTAWATLPVAADGHPPRELAEVRAVVSAGHFLIAGGVAYRWATRLRATYFVVQHGLLTPFAPPLPLNATLFAFSDADGEFWRSMRRDLEIESVGSQMLWNAAAKSAPVPASDQRPVFLGQLHGAELPRSISAATAGAFCSENDASYRPHPAETDRLSRLQHARWRKQGIEVEDTSKPLLSGRPVAAIFSTGVLEAAAAGVPAWVTCVHPPAWVEEFWDRYGLAQWGDSPTPKPAMPAVEPSQQIATRLEALVGHNADQTRGTR